SIPTLHGAASLRASWRSPASASSRCRPVSSPRRSRKNSANGMSGSRSLRRRALRRRRREIEPPRLANPPIAERTFDQLRTRKAEYAAADEQRPRVAVPIDAADFASIARILRILARHELARPSQAPVARQRQIGNVRRLASEPPAAAFPCARHGWQAHDAAVVGAHECVEGVRTPFRFIAPIEHLRADNAWRAFEIEHGEAQTPIGAIAAEDGVVAGAL